MQKTSEATVFIVDDDPDFLTALALMLESTGLRVETFPGAQEFLGTYTPDRPGCLVTDVRLRGMSGLDLLERLGGKEAPLPVILVTGYGDFQMAVRAFKAGATDIFQKPFDDQEVIDRVWQSIRDDKATRAARTERAEVSARLKLLTPRERAVLELLVNGRASKEIAAELTLSVRTVESHRARILEKLGVDSATQVVRLALLARERP